MLLRLISIFPMVSIGVILMCSLTMSGCSFRPQRTGYDRKSGTWPKPTYKAPSERNASAEQKSSKPSGQKWNQASMRGGSSTSPTSKSLKKVISPWIGTPYRYGGSSRKGIDCSGFVMNVMNQWQGIQLPHSAKQTYRFGKSISRSDLEPGDVVFFGSAFSITHNGIYVGNGQFAHASTSRGVMYEELKNSYWSPKYQGARRY